MISKSRFIVQTSSLLIFCWIFFTINAQATDAPPSSNYNLIIQILAGQGTITSSTPGIKCTLPKSVTSTCSNSFPAGTKVTLTATPDPSNSFLNWSGACSGTATAGCAVTMDKDETVVATFAAATSSTSSVSQLQAKFAGLNLGVGLAGIYWTQNDVGVGEAVVSNGIVRVTKTNKSWVGIVLESHYFFTPDWFNPECLNTGSNTRDEKGNVIKNNGIGPFVAVMPGTDNLIQAFGGGVMTGFRRNDTSSSFNLGLGFLMNPNQQVLGDGIVENQPLPAGESGVRFKTVTAWGYIFICSFTF